MARVGRLAGAILAETGGDYYLVGHPKVPCDWRASGFEPPREITGVIDARVTPVVRLARAGAAPPALGSPVLVVETEGEALARLLADAFVIRRTGSVSERLWRLAIGKADDSDDDASRRHRPHPGALARRAAAGHLADRPRHRAALHVRNPCASTSSVPVPAIPGCSPCGARS